ncbi:MAG TPA: hypothetical protein VG797_00765, partial [Phycisphaerales bacterium]|nr:hypothetical protein [Phycisphaerales bacterium]
MAWLAVVGFFAAFAPVIANGHPWRYRVIGEGAAGARGEWTSPMVRFFSPTDWVLLVGVPVGLMVVLPRWRTLRFSRGWRRAGVVVVGLVVWGVMSAGWKPALETWPYRVEIAAGRAEGSFAPVPWSPMQRVEGAKLLAPGAVAPGVGESGKADGMFALGTDSMGADVLSQMIHACRLALGVGLVGTVIAFVIGVVMGALMGYFGGVVDLVLYRVTEIVMGVPVVVLLILAASVLPRDVM